MPAYACGPFVVPVGSVAFGSVGVFFEKKKRGYGGYIGLVFLSGVKFGKGLGFFGLFCSDFLCNFTYMFYVRQLFFEISLTQ